MACKKCALFEERWRATDPFLQNARRRAPTLMQIKSGRNRKQPVLSAPCAVRGPCRAG
jgi:hypothetical protein